MANWSNPTLTSLYTDFLSELKARDEDLAKQFDGQTVSNLVTGTIRWSSSANRWQKWDGSAWGELTTTYALTGLSTTGNASIGGTLGVTGAATLSGGGTSITPATADNSTAIATTAFVKAQAYATLASPALTGTPTAPTAAVDTNTTQVATTAFVIGQGADSTPLMAGTAAVGTSLEFARGDHVHPTDTSRAPLASPTFTGTPAAPTAAVGTNTTQLATTAFVQAEIANDAPAKDGTGATGTWGISITGNAATATTLATARTINGVSFNGSANITVTASTTAALTAGSFLTAGGTFDGSTARTFAVDATSANTPDKVVARDGSGNFSAGTITAALTGTASGNLALTGGTLSGAMQTIAGTAGAPGIGIGEATTGLFRPATGVLALSTGGSERARIDSSARLLVGTDSAKANFFYTTVARTPSVQIETTLTQGVSILSTDGLAGLQLVDGRTSTAVDRGLGILRFQGFDGTNYRTGATIEAATDAVTSTAVMPGRLVFSTTADGANSPTERLRLDSDGNVQINNTNAAVGGYNARLHVANTDPLNDWNFALTATGANTLPSSLLLFKTRNTSPASLTAVVSGDRIGEVFFGGASSGSTSNTNAALIRSTATANWTSTSTPADLQFITTASGTTSTSLVCSATADTYLRMGASSGGIQFNGDTAAANALDDYEEGTWTPVVADASSAGNTATGTFAGHYTKIGNLVTVTVSLTNINTTGMTAGNDLFIQGLPFAAASLTGTVVFTGAVLLQSTTVVVNPVLEVGDNTSYMRIAELIAAAVRDFMIVSEFTSGSADVYGTLTYQAA